MTNTLTRTAVLTVSAGLLATGMTAAIGAAEAAPGPLRVIANQKCVTSHDRPGTDNIVIVSNPSRTTVRGISIRIIGNNGDRTVGIPTLRADQETRPRTTAGNRWYSSSGVRTRNTLRPGESVKYWYVSRGCNGPWATAGVVTSDNTPDFDFKFSADRPARERN